MARIRTVKPEMFTSSTVTALSLPARWTFVGMLTYVDDEGYAKSDARLVKAAVWPLDDNVTAAAVEGHLEELVAAGLVCRSSATVLHVVNFTEHQRVNRPTPTKYEACRRAHGGLTEGSRSDPGGLTGGKEGKGREQGREGSVAPQASATAAAQTLVAEWIDHCSGGRPPSRVVGQVAREVGKMLDEGIPATDVRAGLATWHTKGLHPSTLASVVHEVRTGGDRKAQPKPSTTDERVAATLELAARYAAAEGTTPPAIGA